MREAILDKNVRVPEDATIGYDLESDRRFHHVTESGIVVAEGNRNPEETRVLDDLIYDLQMRFVRATKSSTS